MVGRACLALRDPQIDFVRFDGWGVAPVGSRRGVALAAPVSLGVLPATAIGGDLCNRGTAFSTQAVPAGAPFSIPIPDDCSLIGTEWCVQAGSIGAAGVLRMTNSLRITLGAF